jgi:hypothetical protein
MKRRKLNLASAVGCALLLAIPMTAANKPAPEAHKKPAKEIVRHAWRPETLSGKIMTVDPAKKLVVLKDQNGVPFDMVVTSSTRIKSGDRMLKLSDLGSQTDHSASVHFIPQRRGDVAQSIQITG